jgi:hypothetical protein
VRGVGCVGERERVREGGGRPKSERMRARGRQRNQFTEPAQGADQAAFAHTEKAPHVFMCVFMCVFGMVAAFGDRALADCVGAAAH